MSEQMKSGKSTGGVKIDPISAAPLPQEKGWVSVLKAFNPLGPLAESYARTLAYRIECKRLESEVERVKVQAGLVHDALDKTYKLKMEELMQRRIELDRFYDTVQGVLSHLHIERMTVLKMAEQATAKALDDKTDPDARLLFKQMATEIITQIPNFGDRANESLDFEMLPMMPRFTVERVKTALATTFPTANATVKTLEELGLIIETTGQKKNRSFSYDRYIQLLSA